MATRGRKERAATTQATTQATTTQAYPPQMSGRTALPAEPTFELSTSTVLPNSARAESTQVGAGRTRGASSRRGRAGGHRQCSKTTSTTSIHYTRPHPNRPGTNRRGTPGFRRDQLPQPAPQTEAPHTRKRGCPPAPLPQAPPPRDASREPRTASRVLPALDASSRSQRRPSSGAPPRKGGRRLLRNGWEHACGDDQVGCRSHLVKPNPVPAGKVVNARLRSSAARPSR